MPVNVRIPTHNNLFITDPRNSFCHRIIILASSSNHHIARLRLTQPFRKFKVNE